MYFEMPLVFHLPSQFWACLRLVGSESHRQSQSQLLKNLGGLENAAGKPPFSSMYFANVTFSLEASRKQKGSAEHVKDRATPSTRVQRALSCTHIVLNFSMTIAAIDACSSDRRLKKVEL